MLNKPTHDTVHVESRSGAAGDVAVLTIDFPPVNAGSTAMRTAVLAAFQGLETEGLAGVVLDRGRWQFRRRGPGIRCARSGAASTRRDRGH
ncbi:hypothetical protein [Breoghania sp.]|uniref:hypothetical protein n=1 Tax=Breoghania sp. TaxID=2065378 RepID=UPI00261073F8|nr:hypothetical protein [Breoghania sp.]